MPHPAEYYSDYPDAQVTPELDRHIVLTGPPGVGVKSVGTALCSLSGWAYVEVDRLVEHDVGCAIAGLVAREGLALVSARCWSQVYRALVRSPAAVIVVHAPVLAHRSRLNELLERARLVYLDADPADLAVHLKHRQTQRPGELAWFGRSPIELDAVHALVRESDPVRRAAHEVRRVRPDASLRAARAILADQS